MSYEGVKYRTVVQKSMLPSDPRVEELRAWCRIFHAHGLAPFYPGGTHGNMSFRIRHGEDAFVITAARSSFADEMPDDAFFTVTGVKPEKMTVFAMGNPDREPSSETLLHHAIYQARSEVQAILHGHCRTISQHAEAMKIPTTREFVESGTLKIVESVLHILLDHPFIEIRDHGFMSLGPSIQEAGERAMDMLTKSRAF